MVFWFCFCFAQKILSNDSFLCAPNHFKHSSGQFSFFPFKDYLFLCILCRCCFYLSTSHFKMDLNAQEKWNMKLRLHQGTRWISEISDDRMRYWWFWIGEEDKARKVYPNLSCVKLHIVVWPPIDSQLPRCNHLSVSHRAAKRKLKLKLTGWNAQLLFSYDLYQKGWLV